MLTGKKCLTMSDMWQEVTAYFQNGPSSSNPLRFRTHLCLLQPPASRNGNLDYGFEVDEEAMTIFSCMGGTSRPPCTCKDLDELVEDMENFMSSCATPHPDDYTIHTEKSDTSIEEVALYTMRDTLQWWVTWQGSIGSHFWKHLYVAIITICDDVAIPPQDLANGTFRFLGYTLEDILDGLHSEGVHPDDIRELKMLTWRQFICQYLEKVHPRIRARLLSQTTMMTQFRVMTGNPQGAALTILASRATGPFSAAYDAVELAGIGVCLSLDIGKEARGVLQGEETETVAGKNRDLLKSELRWIYARSIELLDVQPLASLVRRFATSGFSYVLVMDRYLEWTRNTRIPMTPGLRHMIDSYRGLQSNHIPISVDEPAQGWHPMNECITTKGDPV
ncbi:hypothetical protein ASPWEDRAFT_238086 [Aspergillus wentii DTO 134E9]|uniref:Uncharacterized protein n=1 Tax=Aspergillus wentii DTO 134E9 TaxID=1073089 RepID=A0A1L9S1A3_ASPWE|nr:uncharacterized protein ASPWEDRAFT_238086 [Aspergillus wentii DTO 134E9]KAI9931056.1 hypothetical protein MW887_010712 [Aspergillus wentii]OJJ40949.1 hypothetical protein ASPWEDRAFT_238086 [Aspergillus wentii DTO 134E9]